MIKNQYFFQLFSSLYTLLLLAITPAASVAVGNKKNSNTALIAVDGHITEHELAEGSSVMIPLSSVGAVAGAITSASVMTNNVRCFFHGRIYCDVDPTSGEPSCGPVALGSDGQYSQSYLSPVFRRNYDLEFSDEFQAYKTLVY